MIDPISISGWMEAHELEWLQAPPLPTNYHSRLFLEIGVWKGRSTSAIANGLSESFGDKLIAIDHFAGSPIDGTQLIEIRNGANIQSIARENLSPYIKSGLLKLLPMPSDIAILALRELLDRPIDFLFIDGDHEYNQVRRDLLNYSPLVKRFGIIAGHDRNFAGVRAVLNEFIPSFREGPGTIWWSIKE